MAAHHLDVVQLAARKVSMVKDVMNTIMMLSASIPAQRAFFQSWTKKFILVLKTVGCIYIFIYHEKHSCNGRIICS
jgi:hypothetical protein